MLGPLATKNNPVYGFGLFLMHNFIIRKPTVIISTLLIAV